MLDSLDLQRILINGTVFSLTLGFLVMASLKYNARLWLQDYPKAIRDMVPPLTALEKRQRVVVAVAVIGTMFGGIILTVMQLRSQSNGALSFGVAYLNIFLMLAMFNLFDALVLDLFILTLFKPKFAILPGAEGMEYLFNDYRKHLTDFVKGIVFSIVASAPFALIAVL
jgi:hypothetical protein